VGSIGPFLFLNDFWSQIDWTGLYRNVEKGLLIIYHLLTGNSFIKMSDFIPKTSFQSLHTELYEKHIKQLNKWLDEKLTTLFSTPAIRVLSAHLNNPSEFQSITLYADGHDNQINYNSIFEID
jgi:hypothetical protein